MVDVSSQLFSYIGWLFLPRYATSFLQSVYYRITIRAGDPHPQRGTARHTRDYRRIYLLVIVSYLLYTLVDAYKNVCGESDFYQILGVLPTADDRTIKSRFRRLAAIHHPDKIQQSSDANDEESPDALFLALRLAQDTLLDPAKRFAYDRFGPSVVEDPKKKTILDFLYSGLQILLPQYTVGLFVTVVLNIWWFSAWGRYWRFYLLLSLFTLEVALLTHPTGVFMPSLYLPTWLSSILRLDTFYLLPFQILSLARTTSMALNIFISQVAPPQGSQQASQSANGGTALTQTHQRLIMQLGQVSHLVDAQTTKLMQMEFAPYKGDKKKVEKLRKGMKDWVTVGSNKERPEVQQAVKQVMERRKEQGR